MFENPHDAPLPNETLEVSLDGTHWSRSPSTAENYYTAALSAFLLWGDCELARQCLESAIYEDPVIMVRILGGADKPSELIISF